MMQNARSKKTQNTPFTPPNRMSPRNVGAIVCVAVMLLAFLIYPLLCSSDRSRTAGIPNDSIITDGLEIPVMQRETPGILLRQYGYVVSYNPEQCIPNWVAWRLDPEKLVERESRSKQFLPNPQLKPEEAVTTDEYKGSGWDRGHMCPAGDNKWHWRAMDECFYMTNICPQNHNLNRGDWKELEEMCRRLAAEEPVYIVCGPVLYRKPKYGYIGRKFRIRVPDAFFKVMLTGLESGSPRAIGFLYKNEAGNRTADKYVNSVDEIERITSMDFFSSLPDEVEDRIEAECDLSSWIR